MRTIRSLLALLLVLGPACSQSLAQGTIELANRLPSVEASNSLNPSSAAGSAVFSGPDGAKNTHNVELLAATGAIASDDTGIHKTLYAAPGSTTYKISSDITKLGDLTYTGPLLAGVYLTGGQRNETLATDAAIAVFKAGVIGTVVKYLVGRHRPNGPSGGGNADRFSPGNTSDSDSSFPSGHTEVAFSVASVWAHDKPKEKVIAYGLAGLVGISRLTLSAHWASDVLAGAALGIAEGRQVDNGNTNLLSFRF